MWVFSTELTTLMDMVNCWVAMNSSTGMRIGCPPGLSVLCWSIKWISAAKFMDNHFNSSYNWYKNETSTAATFKSRGSAFGATVHHSSSRLLSHWISLQSISMLCIASADGIPSQRSDVSTCDDDCISISFWDERSCRLLIDWLRTFGLFSQVYRYISMLLINSTI